jgi:hypothetical protein
MEQSNYRPSLSELNSPCSITNVREMLASGRLQTVVAAAKEIGFEITSRTACRWAIHGRDGGKRLPTVRVRNRLLTTTAALKAWLDATAVHARVGGGAQPSLGHNESNKVLKAFGLDRGAQST